MTPLFFALAGMCALAGCKRGQPSARPGESEVAPAAVKTASIQWHPVQRWIDVTGTLYGDEEADVAARVPGPVATILKDLGDRVESGELLARVDPTNYELARLQAEASLAEALARVGLDALPPADSNFDVAALPAVQRAQAEEANARARFDRTRELFEDDPPLVSEQDFADVRTALEVASRNVTVEKLLARSFLSAARTRAAELAEAEQRVRDTEIRAPANAREGSVFAVAGRRASVGEFLTAGQVVFSLIDADPIKFRADVAERFAGAIQIGQKVSVSIEGLPDASEGVIVRLAPRVDPESRTFLIEAEVPNADGRLKPGSFARGRIATTIDERVPFVPNAAIVSFAGVKRVFTVEAGKAMEHRITTGVSQGEHVEVIGGSFAENASIIVEGSSRVAAGSPVIADNASEQTAAAAANQDQS